MTYETTTETFAGQVLSDVAASMSGIMTSIGNKLGLYQAMAYAGPDQGRFDFDKTKLQSDEDIAVRIVPENSRRATRFYEGISADKLHVFLGMGRNQKNQTCR